MDTKDIDYLRVRWADILAAYPIVTTLSLFDYRAIVAIDLLQALDPTVGKTSYRLSSDIGVERSIIKAILDSDFAAIPRIDRLYFRP